MLLVQSMKYLRMTQIPPRAAFGFVLHQNILNHLQVAIETNWISKSFLYFLAASSRKRSMNSVGSFQGNKTRFTVKMRVLQGRVIFCVMAKLLLEIYCFCRHHENNEERYDKKQLHDGCFFSQAPNQNTLMLLNSGCFLALSTSVLYSYQSKEIKDHSLGY